MLGYHDPKSIQIKPGQEIMSNKITSITPHIDLDSVVENLKTILRTDNVSYSKDESEEYCWFIHIDHQTFLVFPSMDCDSWLNISAESGYWDNHGVPGPSEYIPDYADVATNIRTETDLLCHLASAGAFSMMKTRLMFKSMSSEVEEG